MDHVWRQMQEMEDRMQEVEDRMQSDLVDMHRMMDKHFEEDFNALDQFFYLHKLGVGPHPARQRLEHGRLLTDKQERERSARKVEASFHKAVRAGDTKKVASLLQHGLVENVDRSYTYGGHETNPLIDACSRGYLSVVRLLIEKGGADVNRQVGSQTPLYVAAKEGHRAIVDLLLEKGAEVEPRMGTRRNSAVAELPGGSLFRDTPLHAAVRQHHHDVIDALLGGGASFLSPDYAGDTALDLLRRWVHEW